MKAKILIPLVTFCLVSLPIILLSISMKGFWITSPYDFPLVLIPAFLIGDPLLLPPLNYHIYVALKQSIHLLPRRVIAWTIFYCSLLSILFNSCTHYLWSHSAYTSFISPQFGMLSAAGWWHYGISILQITLIVTFGALGMRTVRQQADDMFKAFERATYILITFSLVNLTGALITKDLIVSMHLSPNYVLPNLINGSLPLILEIGFLVRMRKAYQLTQSGALISAE